MKIFVSAPDTNHGFVYLIPGRTEKEYLITSDIAEVKPFTSTTNARKAIEKWKIENTAGEYEFDIDDDLASVIKEFDRALGDDESDIDDKII